MDAMSGGGGGTSDGVSALAPFSFDWIGGDIAGLSALAAILYGYAPAINGVTSALDGQVQGLVGACAWTGAAASAFEREYEADATAAAWPGRSRPGRGRDH